jgi:hypothetical protein
MVDNARNISVKRVSKTIQNSKIKFSLIGIARLVWGYATVTPAEGLKIKEDYQREFLDAAGTDKL